MWIYNYYSLPILFLELYEREINACGTILSWREFFPEDLKAKKSVERGCSDYRTSGPLLICLWKDKRVINFIKTVHEVVGAATVARRDIVDNQFNWLTGPSPPPPPPVFLITNTSCVV